MLERLRRHPVLTFLALLSAAAGVALTFYLYSFDLNDYRNQLQTSLQSALKRPVKIGSIHFALRPGLSLEISAVALGNPEDTTSLLVDHLILHLRFAPLLRRQLSFSSVVMEGAQLRIVEQKEERSDAATAPPPARMNELIDLLRRTDISSLLLRKSRVTIIAGERSYSLEKVDLKLQNIAFLTPIPVTASGELHAGTLQAPWQLAGVVEAAGADAPWQATRVDLTLGLKRIDLTQLPQLAGQKELNFQLKGRTELTLHATGAPVSGLNVEVHAASQDFSLAVPALYHKPLHAQEALLSGIWQSGEAGSIRDLLLRLDTFSLRGNIVLPTATGGPLVATLAFAETPLARLGRFVPDRTLPALATTLRDPQVSGSVAMEKIELRWSAAAGMQLDNALLHLRNGRFPCKGVGLVENAVGDGEWQDGALAIKNVKATLLGGQSEGAGNIAFPEKGEPIFNLQIASTATAEALIPLLPTVWGEKLQASGPISFSGKVGGTPSRLLIDLQSRFDAAAVSFNQIPLKRAGEVGELLILGSADSSGLELSHSRLALPFAEARANGHLALDASGGYTLACDINNLSIEKLPPFLAVQKELQGHGEVDLRLDLSGDQKGLKSLQGNGEYRKLGIHLWDAVANLRGASGRMLLTREGIDFPEISGLLGLSPVRARGELKWLPAFSLTLDLDLARTRAVDLVFKSPKKTFSTIRGRLVISETEILFEKIAAEIADETTALINGRLSYDPTRVVLDIVASRGNIAGIIALWQDGEKQTANNIPAAPSSPLTVEITTAIAAGDLYGATFQHAQGTVALREGRLFIEPLRLKIGEGNATVAISTGPLHDEYPLFKVSGQAGKIDAAQVQRQLLGRQGSITGTLDSSFSLQGELGRFLPTCNGNVNLRLNQGLLRGFTSISRALALFNVGKILTFNFPDIATDGLLFDRVKGNLAFTNGVVSSEDLAVASAAFDMAFVGRADLARDSLDFIIGVKPLQTVDKVLSSIPLAGWILTGEKKAFVIANFHVTGSSQDPQVKAVPFSSLSDMAVGIFKRTFGLPAKIVNDVQELFR